MNGAPKQAEKAISGSMPRPISVPAIAHSVRAEGVELEEQRDFLRSLGCNTMQGYLFSKPLDAAAMTRYLQTTLAPTDSTDAPASH
mgnify:CR=1 FL=1